MAEAVRNKLASARIKLFRKTSGLSDPSTGSTSPSPETEQPCRPNNRRKSSFASLSRSSTRPKHEASLPTVDQPREPEPVVETNTANISVEEPTPERPPTLTIQRPTSPELVPEQKVTHERRPSSNNQLESLEHPDPQPPHSSTPSSQASQRPPLTRTSTRGSYFGVNSLPVNNNTRPSTRDSEVLDTFVDAVQAQSQSAHAQQPSLRAHMSSSTPRRKVWVRRPNASATLVPFGEDDLVDDVRDTLLRKYANSLGRSFDSPDVTIRIQPRERTSDAGKDRSLGPEEHVQHVLDAYFPGGQDVTEALLIDVPQRRTPRASPRIIARAAVDYHDDGRPSEDDAGYFPPMPVSAPPGGQLTPQERPRVHAPHSIAILETGQAPSLPSPGAKRTRPRPHRQHTSSPTVVSSGGNSASAAGYTNLSSYGHGHGHTPKQARTRRDSNDRLKGASHAPNPPPLPSPPGPEVPAGVLGTTGQRVATPPAGGTVGHPLASATSPRLPPGANGKTKKSRKAVANGHREATSREGLPLLALGQQGLVGAASVPPINVLIVEDNIINLRLMEMFVGRLKVRWGTAMNGRDAVTKWREGGYHLVLMDIQLPIMSGLEATKEIRRLERVNGIGVFARADEDGETSPAPQVNGTKPTNDEVADTASSHHGNKEAKEEDKLSKDELFKSPVIIVALTASSLQSDRREALAAGCNDFLTKPVNFGWFERKVMEWGCMQALIDFNGWRQWKELGARQEEAEKKKRDKEETAEQREKRLKKEAKRMEMLKKMGQA